MLNLAQDVKILAGYCVFMRSIFLHNRILFEESTGERKEMMSRVANIFFGDLSSMLREYIILQVCKITDPAKDARGNDNQTIDFLLQHFVGSNSEPSERSSLAFEVEPATMQRLTDLNSKLQDFRRKILPARNKLISHLDRETIRSGAPLGGVPDSEWNEFWSNLQDLVCIIYDKVVGGRFYINTTRSDADGLLNSLQSYCRGHARPNETAR
jgi:hypothetical protein